MSKLIAARFRILMKYVDFCLLMVPLLEHSKAYSDDTVKFAPLPKSVSVPKDNPMSKAKIRLGTQLFFDPRLSGDNKISCATCHSPDKAFADGMPKGKGVDGETLKRNTPTVLNAAFFKRLLWDGRADSLEEQALGPIKSPHEMNQDLNELEDELNDVPGYVDQFKKVFGTKVTRQGIAKSLAAFQRTLISGPSPFDRYLAGDENALSDDAKRGFELFKNEAGCARCHNGPLLSDGKFYRLGVTSKDQGRGAITGKKADNYKFRTPSLRNIADTGPYMHNGSQATLDDVVTFYYRGIPTAPQNGHKLDAEPLLGNSFTEIAYIVAFLESLSGPTPKVTRPRLP